MDLEHGSFLHLPYDGGVMEQPYKTFELFKLCRQEYVNKLAKDRKEHQKKNAIRRK